MTEGKVACAARENPDATSVGLSRGLTSSGPYSDPVGGVVVVDLGTASGRLTFVDATAHEDRGTMRYTLAVRRGPSVIARFDLVDVRHWFTERR